jgi:hypothetical protein
MERIQIDLFNMALDVLVSIHTPATLSPADMNPVCCSIAGSGESFGIDKGFEQQRFNFSFANSHLQFSIGAASHRFFSMVNGKCSW